MDMKFDNVNISIIQEVSWGVKHDPTEYDYDNKAIRIRRDYFNRMKRNEPITHHWIYHEFAHHMMSKVYGMEFIKKNGDRYPDNFIERFAFAYQFYYLMQSHTCNTINELYEKDSFFRHKRMYNSTLSYYWNNANIIISEFNDKMKLL